MSSSKNFSPASARISSPASRPSFKLSSTAPTLHHSLRLELDHRGDTRAGAAVRARAAAGARCSEIEGVGRVSTSMPGRAWPIAGGPGRGDTAIPPAPKPTPTSLPPSARPRGHLPRSLASQSPRHTHRHHLHASILWHPRNGIAPIPHRAPPPNLPASRLESPSPATLPTSQTTLYNLKSILVHEEGHSAQATTAQRNWTT